MPSIKFKCDICSHSAEALKEYCINGKLVTRLSCNHLRIKEPLDPSDPSNVESLDGKKLFAYQAEGVRFTERSGGRCLIADEMRLGKTVQALTFLKLHPECMPVLCVVKSSIKIQWQREIMRWCGEDAFAQIITDNNFLPGLPAYVVSYDMLRRLSGVKAARAAAVDKARQDYNKHGFLKAQEVTVIENQLVKTIKRLKIKTIILDECQQIKNSEAQRTQEVRQICAVVDNVIALSGTPIKNHALEYYPVLNILRPELFPSEASFIRQHISTTYNGKLAGLSNPEYFKELTKNFIIRRVRKDAMPDMPSIWRDFSFHELSKSVEAAYVAAMKKFNEEYDEDDNSFAAQASILAYLSTMRHLTGLSKVDPCIDYVTEFLGSTDRKITVFVHHKDVGELLMLKLKPILEELGIAPARNLTSDLNDEARQRIVDTFQYGETRVLVASTLASGEGLTLSACSDFIMLERQWNPANEEQAESRFPHVEKKDIKINGTYFVAIGTVDEFFAELVERKREIVTKTLGGEACKWDESSLIKELASMLHAKGGKKWGF